MKKLICLFILLFSAPTFAADKMRLILDWFINPDHGPIIIAQEKGYFAEQNLEIEVIPPADPADPPKLVAAGKADLAVSYQPQLHLQVAEGLPLVRVGTLVATPLNCLLVLEDGPIKEISQLKGKKVGFSVAGVEEALLTAILKNNGVSFSDIELVNVNWSLSPSLMSGQVDAVIGAFRNFELKLIYVANNENIDKEKIGRFLAATEKATQFMVNHPTESWEIFSSTAKELQDELNKRAWRDTLPRFALRPAAMDVGRYQRMEQFLVDADLLKETRSVDELAIDVTK